MSDVEIWFTACANPLRDLMREVHRTALQADPRMQECIKWSAPTVDYKGPLATLNPRSKSHVTLTFHRGGTIPGDFPHLEGEGPQARVMRFASAEDLAAKADELRRVVRAWCDMRDAAP